MPSLSELEKFKASLNKIGDQKAILEAQNIPFEDLKLPDSEPVPLDADPKAPAGEAQEPPPEVETYPPETDSIDDIDYSGFINPLSDSIPDQSALDAAFPGEDQAGADVGNLNSQEPDASAPEEPAQAEGKPLDLDSLDNFDFPEEPIPPRQSRAYDAGNYGILDASDEPVSADSSAPVDSPVAEPDEPVLADLGAELESTGGLPDSVVPEDAAAADSGETSPDDLGDLSFLEDTASMEGAESFDTAGLDDFDLPEDTALSGDSDLSLGDLGDLDLPEDAASAEGSENLDLDALGDLDFPEDIASADGGESPSLDDLGDLDLPEGAASAEGSENFDLDALGDLDFPEDTASAGGGESPSLDDLGDLGFPEDTASADGGESPSLDDLGDLGFPEDTASADGGESPSLDDLGDLGFPEDTASADGGEGPSLDDLGDLDFPEDTASADGGESPSLDDLGDFGFPEDTASADGEPFTPDDSFAAQESVDLGSLDDLISPNEDVPSDGDESFESGDSGSIEDIIREASVGADDDFSLDDILKKSQKKPEPEPKTGKGKKGKEKKSIYDVASEEVEEILLSPDELQGIQDTLSRYPLNLRLACEEIIVEHVVNPRQMSDLIEHLVWGASAKETAILVSKILGRAIEVPKGFEKSSGEALEAEKASFPYIFVHSFLPVLRLFLFIAAVAASIFYLIYKFAYIPAKAESIYKIGYERIYAGEYERANERFNEAFNIHRKKTWFYDYAEAFRDEKQFLYAEQKYDELLSYYPRDKKGVLDYAHMQTYYLRNYAKADAILRHNLLEHDPNDMDALLAAGDNNLIWGEIDPSRYEIARYMYARLLEKYGWNAPVVERMMKYFIRTDDLGEVLHLRNWFDNNPQWTLSAESMGELGGYLLDKKLEEVRGVPNEFVDRIEGIRDLLLKAVYADPMLPESHYHLARYYHSLGNDYEERKTLHQAIRAFDLAAEETVRRRQYRIDAHQRFADALINAREFIPAEEQLVKGINLYEDAVSRRLISRMPQYGKLYSTLGDIEYFTKTGDMEAALRYYHRSEQDGWAPPEMRYRIGAAYYQMENWEKALEYLFSASSSLPLNRRVLFSLGNSSLKRGNYFAALGYYNRLIDILESQRSRLPTLLPNDRPEFLELAERLMMARNNAGVACEMLAAQTGDRSYLTRALAFYAEAQRAWDARTRDPRTMLRSGSTPLPHLNGRNALYPQLNYDPQIFIRVDNEALESSPWETLAPLARLDHGRDN